MARLYRKHKRTYADIDVLDCARVSANKSRHGNIVVNLLPAWNPQAQKAAEGADHHIVLSHSEAAELIAHLAGALVP